MQFVETLNELLPWDPMQCAVSPGQRILALVIAYIEDRKALYRIEEAYTHRDVELLLGQGVAAEQLNDKALALDWLEGWIGPEKRQQTLFVADSTLITGDNLRHLDQGGYRFVSRLPDTFGYATVARSEALYGPADKWEDIGKLAHEKKASEYQLPGEIEEREYRLIVVRSSRLFELKQKALERKADKEREAIQRAGRKIGRETFSCHEDAEAALQTLLGQLGLRFWTTEHYVEEAVIEPPRRRGRPAKAEEPPAGATVYRIHLAPAALDRDAFERECRWQSTFVLISNDTSRTAKNLFLSYRGQAAAESEFRWLKSPVYVSPVFLKRPTRVAAFGYVMLMAYLVYALVQRAIRNALPDGEFLDVEGSGSL